MNLLDIKDALMAIKCLQTTQTVAYTQKKYILKLRESVLNKGTKEPRNKHKPK